MVIGGLAAGLRPIGQILGGIGSIVGAARYVHSRTYPRIHHSIRNLSNMPNYRRRPRRYGRTRRRRQWRKRFRFAKRLRRKVRRLRARRGRRKRPFRSMGKRVLAKKLVRRSRFGGRFGGIARHTTMTLINYDEEKKISQLIYNTTKEKDLFIQKIAWLNQKWLPDTDLIPYAKLSCFANYRYCRLRKLLFAIRYIDEVNMMKYSDDTVHMNVPRILGFRYTHAYQSEAADVPAKKSIDQYDVEHRLNRVKNVVNRSQRTAFHFSYRPDYRLNPCYGWCQFRGPHFNDGDYRSSYDTVKNRFASPALFLDYINAFRHNHYIVTHQSGAVNTDYFNPQLIWVRTLDIKDEIFKPSPSVDPGIHSVKHEVQYTFEVKSVWEFKEPVLPKIKKSD